MSIMHVHACMDESYMVYRVFYRYMYVCSIWNQNYEPACMIDLYQFQALLVT